MLSELHIENFALVDRQSISFGPGLNVISGETGSGKSIVLSAIQFLLGEKLKTSPLRAGAEHGEVQGLFQLDHLSPAACAALPDIVRDDDGAARELSVVRSLNKSGKNKVFLNGRLANVGLLEEVMARLVNICGQNHHVRLLDQRYHLETLDGFVGHTAQLSEFRGQFEQWRELSRTLSEIERSVSEHRAREEQLRETVNELEAARLTPGLRAELENRVRTLGNAERVTEASQRATSAISEEGGVSGQMQRLQVEVSEIEKLDPSFSSVAQNFASARRELREFEFALQRYVSQLNIDDERLAALREQLAEVARLERKYRRNDSELIELLAESRAFLSEVGGADRVQALRSELKTLEGVLAEGVQRLRTARLAGAKKLARAVETGLADVAMSGSSFKVDLVEASLGVSGADRVEFLLSSNKGEPPRALREIASGGELSRILLVLKQVLSDRTGVNILVFDEVDSGISGAVARAVGKKLKALASSSQVICVTHLPQVASLADHHFLVGKHSIRESSRVERTVTQISPIEGDGRVDEIARMLAGYKVTAAARESARELLTSKE